MNNKISYIFAAYTCVLLLVLAFCGYTPYPDSQGYITCAREAIQNGQFYPVSGQACQLPFLWNIGAINAVVLTLYLFDSIVPLLIVYTLMKGCCLLLTYKIAYGYFGAKVAWISCIIYVLYPANYGEATSLLSEVPFVFFILSAVYSSQKGKYILSGILFGLADYLRPFAVIFILAVILSDWRKYRSYIKMAAVYILFIVTVGLTNYYSKGEFIYKAKTGWMALAQYHWEHDSGKTTVNPQTVTENRHITYSQKDKVWKEMFFDWLKDNKTEYVKQIPIKIVNTYISDNISMCTFLDKEDKQAEYMYQPLSLPALLKDFPHYTAVQWLTLVNLLVYYTLMAVFVFSIKYIRVLRLQWAVFILGTLFIALVGHGEARFHIPFMPFLIMAASYNIYRNRLRAHRNRERKSSTPVIQ